MNSSFDSPENLVTNKVDALCDEALKLAEAKAGTKVLLEVCYGIVPIWAATVPNILHKGMGVTAEEAVNSLIQQLRHGRTSLLS